MTLRWLGHTAVDGRAVFRIGRKGDELVAEWDGLCTLRSDRRGERVTFEAEAGADAPLVAKVRNGLAAALVRQLSGGTSLHASAVALEGKSIAFLGDSGAGKSTFAEWMCRDERTALLADDILRVELGPDSISALPSESDHWFENEAGKAPVAAVRAANAPARLSALVTLVWDDAAPEPVALRVRGQRAVACLVPALVRFVIDEPDVQIGELERIERLLTGAPLYELRLRRTFDAMPAAIDLARRLVSGEVPR
jgi:hypothetical protein